MQVEPHPDSYYADSIRHAFSADALTADTQADVCIIGGGFTGISAALHLCASGTRVALLEAHRIGWGASGRNGGQVCTGLRKAQDELETLLGNDAAHQLWSVAESAKDTVRTLIRQHRIDCDYQPGIAHPDHKARYARHSRAYAEKLNRDYGYSEIRYLDQTEMADITGSDTYFGGTLDWGAGHLHPLNFVLGMASAAVAHGAKIFEGSPAIACEAIHNATTGARYLVRTPKGSVRCDRLILAGNAYLDRISPTLARKTASPLSGHIMPINNFVIATEPLPDALAKRLNPQNIAIADSRYVVNYYRLSADKRLLFGGGESYRYRFPKDIAGFVRRPMLQIYPYLRDIRIDYAWSGTLAVTLNRLADVGSLNQGTLLYAQGYSGQGVALATYTGKLIAEKLHGSSPHFDALRAQPTHRFPGGRWLRWPGMVAGMAYYALKDRF